VAFERLLVPLRDGRVLEHASGLLVVDKPAGIPVHGGDEELKADLVSRLTSWLTAAGHDGYVGVHQRLDEGTSGVLLFTSSRARNVDVARASAERSLARRYVAGVTLKSSRFTPHSFTSIGMEAGRAWLAKPSRMMARAAMSTASFW